MAEQQPLSELDRQFLEALKSLGKALSQLSLYKVGHPTVALMLQQALGQLSDALSQAQGGKLLFMIDQEKVIVSGRILGPASAIPNAISALFKKLKLSSLTFKQGITNEELVSFLELAATREVPADANKALADKGVTRIVFNEAVYAIMSAEESHQASKQVSDAEKKGTSSEKTDMTGAAGGAFGGGTFESGGGQDVQAAIQSQSLDNTISALVKAAVPDAAQRSQVLSQVAQLLKSDIEKRVEQVIKPLREEKNRLENEQTRTQGVMQGMAEGVIMVDEHGKILMMNPAAEQLYGTTLAQASGQHLADKAGAEHVVTLAAEISTPKDRPISKEVKVSADEEVKRTVRSAGAVVQNEEGKVVGVVSSLTDVAKHKEVARMQRDFVAHVTHELRAPLSSIRAALEILQGEVAAKIKEEDNRLLTTAMKNSDRLADLINQILDFSKIEAGQMTVYPKKADSEAIAREGVDSLAAWAAKKRINLSMVAAPELPPVLSDSKRTVQVVINLLSNSIKFTPVGGSITVRVAPYKGPSGAGERFIEYAVADTGSGIPKAEQKKIFEKFVQIAAGETHVGGTGLGLAIAKALIHLQAGKMWVESDPGKGATFFFTLPVYTGQKETEADGGFVKKPAAAARPFWKRLLGLK